MQGDPPITREAVEHESQLAGGDIRKHWDSLPHAEKNAYVNRLAANTQEPPELLALLANDPAAQACWCEVHFLVRAEFCAFINGARFGWQRKWRARTALKAAPKEAPYRPT